MPYGYYQFVRVISFTILGYLAYSEHLKANKALFILYLFGAILFNPFIKVALGRTIWQIVDIVVAVFLISTTFVDIKRRKVKITATNNGEHP